MENINEERMDNLQKYIKNPEVEEGPFNLDGIKGSKLLKPILSLQKIFKFDFDFVNDPLILSDYFKMIEKFNDMISDDEKYDNQLELNLTKINSFKKVLSKFKGDIQLVYNEEGNSKLVAEQLNLIEMDLDQLQCEGEKCFELFWNQIIE